MHKSQRVKIKLQRMMFSILRACLPSVYSGLIAEGFFSRPDVSNADLTGAIWDSRPAPKGWKRESLTEDCGKLIRE